MASSLMFGWSAANGNGRPSNSSAQNNYGYGSASARSTSYLHPQQILDYRNGNRNSHYYHTQNVADGSSITTATTAAMSTGIDKKRFYKIFDKKDGMGNLFHDQDGPGNKNLPWIQLTNNDKPEKSMAWAMRCVASGLHICWARTPEEMQRALAIYNGTMNPTEQDYKNFIEVAKEKCHKFKAQLEEGWQNKLKEDANELLPRQTYRVKSRHAPKGSQGHELSFDLTDADAIGSHLADLIVEAYKASDKEGVEKLLRFTYELCYSVGTRRNDAWKKEVQDRFIEKEFNGFDIKWSKKNNFLAPIIATVLEERRTNVLKVLSNKGIKLQLRCYDKTAERIELVSICGSKFIVRFEGEAKKKQYKSVHDLPTKESTNSIRSRALQGITEGVALLQGHLHTDAIAVATMNSLPSEIVDALVRQYNTTRQAEGNLPDHRFSQGRQVLQAIDGGGMPMPQGQDIFPTHVGTSRSDLIQNQGLHFTTKSPYRSSFLSNAKNTPGFHSPIRPRSSPGDDSLSLLALASAAANSTIRGLQGGCADSLSEDCDDNISSEDYGKKRQRPTPTKMGFNEQVGGDEEEGDGQTFSVKYVGASEEEEDSNNSARKKQAIAPVEDGEGDEAAGGVRKEREAEGEDAMVEMDNEGEQDHASPSSTAATTMEDEDKKEEWFLGRIAQVGDCEECSNSSSKVGPIHELFSSKGGSWKACKLCIASEDEKEKADLGIDDDEYYVGNLSHEPYKDNDGMEPFDLNSIYLKKSESCTRHRCQSGLCDFRVCQLCYDLGKDHKVKCEFDESHELSPGNLLPETKQGGYFKFKAMIPKYTKSRGWSLRTTSCSVCRKYFVPSDDKEFPSDAERASK